jgi:hypothetical protein
MYIEFQIKMRLFGGGRKKKGFLIERYRKKNMPKNFHQRVLTLEMELEFDPSLSKLKQLLQLYSVRINN